MCRFGNDRALALTVVEPHLTVGAVTAPLPAGIAGYIAKVDTTDDEYPPFLIRVLRNEDGYEREETWAARLQVWRPSHHQDEDRLGIDNYDDLVEIGEQQALEIQEAWRHKLAEEAPST